MKYLIVIALLLSACSKKEAPKSDAKPDTKKVEKAEPAPVAFDRKKLSLFGELPKHADRAGDATTVAQEDLGRILYYENRLSKNHDVSCNSCHDLNTFGVDNEPTSKGHKAQRGDRNSPTVYNASTHIAQFWDGRAKDVEEQALGPILNPVEHGLPDSKSAMKVLASIPEYKGAFEAAFPNDKPAMTWKNVGRAIGAFERRLFTPSRFDAFAKGDDKALSAQEIAGLEEFISVGCVSCHMGSGFGGTMYQKLGLIKPWPNQKDKGRGLVTENDAELMFFKVPGLRNIEKTGPYFHDGSETSLKSAISKMSEFQLGKELSADSVSKIEAFLKSLTGTLPAEYTKKPTAFKSTAKTPKPQPN